MKQGLEMKRRGGDSVRVNARRKHPLAFIAVPMMLWFALLTAQYMGSLVDESRAASHSTPPNSATSSPVPDTSITAPMARAISGSRILITGIATDLRSVGGVQLRIQRRSGGGWDGSTWDASSTWLPADVSAGRSSPSANWSYTWKIPPMDDERIDIEARAVNSASAVDPTPVSVEMTVDNTIPSIQLFSIGLADAPFTSGLVETLHMKVDGATRMRFAETGTDLKSIPWSDYSDTAPFTLSSGDGTKTVYGQFQDDSDNTTVIGSPGSFDQIILDTVPPSGEMIINNDSAAIDDDETFLVNDVLDDLSGLYQMRFSNNGDDFSEWEPFTPVKRLWDLSQRKYGGRQGFGIKAAYAQFKDRAGNISIISFDDVVYQEQAVIQPHGGYQGSVDIRVPARGADLPRLDGSLKRSPVRSFSGGSAPSSDTAFCLVCHDLHDAPPTSYSNSGLPFQQIGDSLRATDDADSGVSNDSRLLLYPQEKAVCYSCHNGMASVYNTQEDFGDDGVSEDSTRTSSHPIGDATLLCSSCHSSHMQPEDWGTADSATEVIRSLRATFPTFFGYVVRSTNDAWVDVESSGDSMGQKALSNPNFFCGSCHGSGSTLPGGDMSADFIGSEHDTENNGPLSRSGIDCVLCHQTHGSTLDSLLQSDIGSTPITGADQSVCDACHTTSAGRYEGSIIFEKTRHSTVGSSSIALTIWPGTSNDAGWCVNCHDQHGTPYQQDRLADKNALCYTCHDDASKTKPSTYSYRGQAAYEASAHAVNVTPDNVYSVSGDTGEDQTPGECTNCHAVMGRNNGSGGTIDALLIKKQESTCWGGGATSGRCHAIEYDYTGSSDAFYSATGTRTSDVYEQFNPTVRWVGLSDGSGSFATLDGVHDISDLDQTTTNPGARIECYDCHNSHTAKKDYDFSAASRIVSPDSTNSPWVDEYQTTDTFSNGASFYAASTDKDPTFGKNMPNFVNYCIQCHDASLPSGVFYGTNALVNILTLYGNTALNSADQHGRRDGSGGNKGTLKPPYTDTSTPYASMQCTDCHERHGNGNLWMLKKSIVVNGKQMSTDAGAYSVDVVDGEYGGGGTFTAAWCTFCHARDTHNDNPAKCGNCHNHAETF